MRGMIVSALACAVVSGVGCAGSAKFVDKGPNGGVIELKAGADPKEVARLVETELGVGYAIEPMSVPQGSVARGSSFNPTAPTLPGQPPAKDGSPTYYQYSKKTGAGTTPPGFPPAPMDGGIQQTSFQQRPGMTTPTAGMGNNTSMKPPAMFPGQ